MFDSFAPQLDLSICPFAATYGLVGLFLGSPLIGELLVASLLPRHRFAR